MNQKNVVEKLNVLVADMGILFVKLHNLHWNVKGKEFYAIHSMTEEFYEDAAGVFDDLAERVLQLEHRPYASLSEYLEVARIKESKEREFSAQQVLENLNTDYSFLLKEFKELSKLAEGDTTTQSYADDQVAKLEKRLWMIRATLSK